MDSGRDYQWRFKTIRFGESETLKVLRNRTFTHNAHVASHRSLTNCEQKNVTFTMEVCHRHLTRAPSWASPWMGTVI